jgi:hypothetical protein
LDIYNHVGWQHGIASALHSMGDIALFQGDAAEASLYYEQSLGILPDSSSKQ